MNGSATNRRPAQRLFYNLTGSILGACCVLLSPASLAAVYKCEDASGVVSFTDRACPDKLAGTMVEVPRANIDHGYDRNAQGKVRARAKKDAHNFRSRWQAHNIEMKQQADKPEERRLRQYKNMRDPVVKPRSERKQKSPYSVTRHR